MSPARSVHMLYEDWLTAKAQVRVAGFEGPDADRADEQEDALFRQIIATPAGRIADVIAKVRVLAWWGNCGARTDHLERVLIASIENDLCLLRNEEGRK